MYESCLFYIRTGRIDWEHKYGSEWRTKCKTGYNVSIEQKQRITPCLSCNTTRNKTCMSPQNTCFRQDKKRGTSHGSLPETSLMWKKAAAYSPALHCSTIGDDGLNFSVRDGKRWNTVAITTINVFSECPDSTGQRMVWHPHTSKTRTTQGISPTHGKFRAISSARLWRRRLYTCALSTSSSLTTLKGVLILRRASRLDAFSAYPGQTRIPGGAPGGTTGKPEVCPSRSSRTSDGAAQNSNAHDR